VSDTTFTREPIRADSPPAPTTEAQERAHDPALISPEPPADELQQGRLS
jgi:hypothetical protein